MPTPSLRLPPLVALFALGTLHLPAAHAQPAVQVDAVQAPAWVVQRGKLQPLTPGKTLGNRDKVLTGEGGRAVIALGDGSAVKLGERAEVSLNALGRKEDRTFTAAVDVASGAFRLTTDTFQKARQKRAINVRVGTVTAGIRGTDIWGKNDQEKDLICLLEGRITVSHRDGDAQTLDQPNSFYTAAKGQPPAAVSLVDPEQLARWASETELPPDGPSQQRGGRWQLLLGIYASQGEALAALDQLQQLGGSARIQLLPGEGDGGYRYQLRLSGYRSQAAASAAARQWQTALNIEAAASIRQQR